VTTNDSSGHGGVGRRRSVLARFHIHAAQKTADGHQARRMADAGRSTLAPEASDDAGRMHEQAESNGWSPHHYCPANSSATHWFCTEWGNVSFGRTCECKLEVIARPLDECTRKWQGVQVSLMCMKWAHTWSCI